MDGTYLDNILDFHRRRAEEDPRSFEQIFDRAKEVVDSKDFIGAISSSSGLSVIAEIKRRSPSKGDLNKDLDPSSMGLLYEAAGASCISVLTDSEFFSGSREDLLLARRSTDCLLYTSPSPRDS